VATQQTRDNCRASLERVQDFDAASLGREEDLGKQLSFAKAVPLAKDLITVYRRIPVTALNDFTDSQLEAIRAQADADYSTFNQILEFNAEERDAASTRSSILSTLERRRDEVFQQLWQYISYSVARVTDTSLLETQARATIQSIKDEAQRLTDQLTKAKSDADAALAAIRSAAAEQGVSQQAIYFKDEAQNQEQLASTWLTYTYKFAAAVGGFAAISLFLHKIPWLRPENTAEAVQLVSSKVLIFAVLGFLLLMAARNYTTHKHNAVVNRHRQNALLTYRAIVAAAADKGTEDIVLAHAASCIFSPQDTGFSGARGESNTGSRAVLELLTKSTPKAE
jgi:hypothetical protein